MKLLPVLVGMMLVLAGCRREPPAQLVAQFAREYGCPAAQVTGDKVGGVWSMAGCGSFAEYRCDASGTCLQKIGFFVPPSPRRDAGTEAHAP
ncbi:hypothetical protein [Vitiosangium sp. GDMCC 1.1324]|uniref:hypothetical protein n=1 Tax=Vitiosangium sp. (strain GDMCC 1.1324) TaxID=2138576 RepID=UPI000D342381|nr:hypothetical protein [Vitiosangium sp. GDMCC 1.1324]PTL79873.1 hypothetical protein DAT35_31040 [Vitiosangium sp. GDMCC 1.1324]